MTVTSNLAEATDLFRDMSKLQVRAAVSAMNRVATQAQTAGAKAIRTKYPGFKARDVKASLSIYRATTVRLEASVVSKGRRTPLIDASARQTRRGVTVRISKTRKTIPGAFIARMRSGHVGVFTRTAKTRLPIKELYTVAVPEVFVSREVAAVMQAKVREAFIPRYQHELARLAKARAPRVVRRAT